MLSWGIPSSLGSYLKLELINLNGNFLQGPIPSSLSALRVIQNFDISRKKLSVQIPAAFQDFNSLKLLNLSYNNFDNAVPLQGVFKDVNSISVARNIKLCGGIPELNLPKCSIKQQRRTLMLTWTQKILIFMLSGLLCLILLVSVLHLCLPRYNKKESTFNSIKGLPLMLSYQSLSKATGHFSLVNLIGEGCFSFMYKELLMKIKVFDLLHHRALESFMAECEALLNIKHRNLVKILTTCSSIDHQGNDFKALVFEFMENGSLHKWLHPNQTIDHEQTAARSLNFLRRLNVAIDVACELDYLHHACPTTIIHYDIKPTNILLDNYMTAHLGDFGLARFLLNTRHEHEPSTNQSSSIGIRGTVGYAAPEYRMGATLSTQGDVYSYGVLVLEIYTGKRPTDSAFNADLNIHRFVTLALAGQVSKAIDPILLDVNIDYEVIGHGLQELLISVLEIGLACSREVPQEQLEISCVTSELHLIKKRWLNIMLKKQNQVSQCGAE